MISKVAGSFGRITANDGRNWFDRHGGKNAWYNYTMNDNMGWSHGPPSEERFTKPVGKSWTSPAVGSGSKDTLYNGPTTNSDLSISSHGSPSGPTEETSKLKSPPQSPRTDFDNEYVIRFSIVPK